VKHDAIVGCILGTAVGDAIGLPYEGLNPRRAVKLLGPPDRHRLVMGRGMVSDDTEHTCMVAQALIASGGDLPSFQKSLAWRFRLWLLGVPAGIGMATLRAILRLWIGISPQRSGVFSAGNGPAMRAAILGVSIDDVTQLREFVQASSRMTHTDPKAEVGAFAVALAAQMASQSASPVTAAEYMARLKSLVDDTASEFLSLVTKVADSVNANDSTVTFAQSMGLARGVSGYTFHTVPVALHAWLSHPKDFRQAIDSVLACGGDTDTTAAITGGIVGAGVGRAGIPEEWLAGLIEWPRTVAWMENLGTELAAALEQQSPRRPPRLPIAGLMARNLFFLMVVLCHGFRRLAPPY
jgi:ADP-ribosyl-[dinitrogen reductase] hydrolase